MAKNMISLIDSEKALTISNTLMIETLKTKQNKKLGIQELSQSDKGHL